MFSPLKNTAKTAKKLSAKDVKSLTLNTQRLEIIDNTFDL